MSRVAARLGRRMVPMTLGVCVVSVAGIRGRFAISCSRCGGDPERTRETGAASKFTATGCTTVDGLEVDVGNLRFSLLLLLSAAVLIPLWKLGVLS